MVCDVDEDLKFGREHRLVESVQRELLSDSCGLDETAEYAH
jgi:hypothetical protein